MRIALGFRAHSGWAAMVAAAGSFDAPRVLDRRRIVVADPELPGSKQPYHAAEELPYPEAEALIHRAIESSQALACEALESAVNSLGRQGHEVVACGVLMNSARPLPSLESILASHALIHTAEGAMFREVLIHAARLCNIPVVRVREKQLDQDSLKIILTLGKHLGPPWTQDQKYATAAGLMALAESGHGPRVPSESPRVRSLRPV